MKNKTSRLTNKFSCSRRSFIKGISATTLAAFPWLSHADNFPPDSNNAYGGLSIEVFDPAANRTNSDLVRVSIANNANQIIKIKKLADDAIRVDGRVYCLNSRLNTKSITIHPKGVRHFWLKPETTVPITDDVDGTQRMVPITFIQKLPGSEVKRHTRLVHAFVV